MQSDWERHSLSADFAGSYTQYFADLVPSLNVPYMNSKIDGRVDVTRDTQLILQLRGIINTDNPGSPNNTAGLAKLPLNFDVGETVGISQQFNRLAMTFKGTFDRATYDNSVLTNGIITSNGDRNFDQYAGIGRFAYELDPGLKPFVEFEGDQRVHDEQFDRNGLQRNSVGVTGKFGTAVNLFGSLTGEMAIGAVERVYRDPTLPKVAGVIGDGAVIWQPTALTTAKLSATSQVYETVVNGASGELSRDLTLEVDHAFRYWLIGMLKGGYGNDVYPGSGLQDNRWFASDRRDLQIHPRAANECDRPSGLADRHPAGLSSTTRRRSSSVCTSSADLVDGISPLWLDIEPRDPAFKAGFYRRITLQHQRIMPGHDVSRRGRELFQSCHSLRSPRRYCR